MNAVGIDFGTTNSVVATHASDGPEVLPIDDPPAEWAALGFDRVLPSVFARDSAGQPIFGWAAKTRPAAEKVEAVKRLFAEADELTLGGEQILVEEVASHLFGALRQRSAAAGVTVDRAVVTIPANSRGLPRHRTKICAGMAGIEVAALLNEPTAAAMAFALQVETDQNIVVVDWGGGTLDVTLLDVVDGAFLEQASKGIQQLGGIDFDRTIYRHALEDVPGHEEWPDHDVARVRLEVERAKVLLSSQEETTIGLPGGQRKELTRRRVTEWIRPHIQRVREPIERCLDDLKMTTADIDAVLLVGGTCKMPAVVDYVAEILEQEPAKGVDPMTAVAEGAAVAAAILEGEVDSDFHVSTEHALGTVTVDPTTRSEEFSILIPRNHHLPAKHTEPFVPMADYQEAIALRVIEGDPDKPLDDADNVILKSFEVSIPPKPRAEATLAVTYEYDTDGILRVLVEDGTGSEIFRGDVSYVSGRDPKQLVEIAKRVETQASSGSGLGAATTESGGSMPAEVEEIVGKAREKVLPFIDGADADEIANAVEVLEEAAERGQYDGELSALEARLRTYSYLL